MAGPWRLCRTWDLEPALNMGLDEHLALESTAPSPVLRFYTWSPAALSLGYFQRFDDVPAARRAPAVVRRITGGGAIHHEGELTFSIGAPLEHPLFRGPVGDSYERIHELLAGVLEGASLRREQAVLSDQEGTGMCFHDSTPLDLVWTGRKGVGSAQRRKGERVLHHGSIKCRTTELETGVAEMPGTRPEELADRIQRAFEDELGVTFEERAPTGEELARAASLGERYPSTEFVHRR